MFKKYEELFNIYIKSLKKMHEKEEPLDNLCSVCDVYKDTLMGALSFLRFAGVIEFDQYIRERVLVLETFNSITLFCAFVVNDGEVIRAEDCEGKI